MHLEDLDPKLQRRHRRKQRRDLFNGHCAYCGQHFGAERLTLDHVLPKRRGGLDVLNNLLPACAPCNLNKSDRLLDEWYWGQELFNPCQERWEGIQKEIR